MESLATLSYFIIGSTYAFAAAVQPGPLQAFLISHTLMYGWRRTLPGVFAPILSDIPIICLVLIVLTRFPPSFVHILQFAGGLFLLYLALGAFNAYHNYQHRLEASAAQARQTVLKATLVNLLNPNPYLGWALVMGPLLVKAWGQAPVDGIILLGAFYGTMVLTTAVILVGFAGARSFGPRITRILVGVSAAALLLFGLYQAWSGSKALIRRLENSGDSHGIQTKNLEGKVGGRQGLSEVHPLFTQAPVRKVLEEAWCAPRGQCCPGAGTGS